MPAAPLPARLGFLGRAVAHWGPRVSALAYACFLPGTIRKLGLVAKLLTVSEPFLSEALGGEVRGLCGAFSGQRAGAVPVDSDFTVPSVSPTLEETFRTASPGAAPLS